MEIISPGYIEYSKTRHDQNNAKIQVKWSLPTFNEILGSRRHFILHTPKTEIKYDFQLKIEVNRKDMQYTSIEIYYMSLKQIFLKSFKLDMFYDNDDNEEIICLHPKTVLMASSWEYLNRSNTLWGDLLSRMQIRRSRGIRLNFNFEVSDYKDERCLVRMTELINDMENLFLESLYSDVVIKSAEGEEFKCHKAVLANRCAVLKAHFEHNTTESITNVVESHQEAEVLREVLFFIYTGKAHKVNAIPEKLLVAADYYQLSSLKSLCEEVLERKLAVDNAIEILQLADLHSVNTLEQVALKFIKEHQSQITKTEGWAKLKSVELMKKIFE